MFRYALKTSLFIFHKRPFHLLTKPFYWYHKKISRSQLIAMTNYCTISNIIAASVSVANEAGSIIREVTLDGNLEIVLKGYNDPQTEADRRAQHCIINSLRHFFPTVPIVAEEDIPISDSQIINYLDENVLKICSQNSSLSTEIDDKKITIWVDPLDGTFEYTKGNHELVTVLIGVAVEGKAVGGVIHQPFYKNKQNKLGRTIWGIVGIGAFGHETDGTLDTDQRIIVSSHTHETALVKTAITACEPSSVIKIGGAGYKFLLLIEKKAHALLYTDFGYKKWDTCAPDAILRALGGVVTDVHGREFNYKTQSDYSLREGVVALVDSSEKEWYIGKIPNNVKKELLL